MMDPDLDVDLTGKKVQEAGEIEDRRNRMNGVPEVDLFHKEVEINEANSKIMTSTR